MTRLHPFTKQNKIEKIVCVMSSLMIGKLKSRKIVFFFYYLYLVSI